MKTLKMLVEVENSKIYVYSYDSLCASDTVNLWYIDLVYIRKILWLIKTKKKAKAWL